ncbi:hypothetical protein PoB_002571800 [Plakobranchus ocellatus]|uniref:Uncharacterized protein n=1 Tax=Plakobranchus ocellatus TaxID=259542 RepID=A0AAV3ZWI7_9GAST|nr:hypothetical protein PoB_002571800 [Plakobranchus ocellatus]
MMMSDERQMMQLNVTHGMAPLYANLNTVDHNMLKPFIRFLQESKKENQSPLATALLSDRLEIAPYMITNWFLIKVDLVGSPQLPDLRNVLESLSRTEAVSLKGRASVTANVSDTAELCYCIGLHWWRPCKKDSEHSPLFTVLQANLLF